ncbi:hypothetical protein [Sorangium sp. So ce887]|uniref:hypothetical protein n=1 Tax=Sorangium sp. So ce887 TaxID=3133324 RepID=UPI003F626E1F
MRRGQDSGARTSSSPPLTLPGEVGDIGPGFALECWRSEQPPERLVRHTGRFDVAGPSRARARPSVALLPAHVPGPPAQSIVSDTV